MTYIFMALNKKLIIIILLAAIIFFAYFLYRKTYSKIVIKPRVEVTLTIIPGWNLRQVADYLVLKGLATSTEAVYQITQRPLAYKEGHQAVSLLTAENWEGYLAPETYRVFADATTGEVIIKLVNQREAELQSIGREVLIASGRTIHELLTMASIIEKEVKFEADRALVADILWRRVKLGWALQVDSSVHYAINKTGEVFTTAKERAINSPWNTYKYKGLPPGPISNPSLESIKAALYPEHNDYWYFLSGKDGKIYYAKTLEEHNANKKYL